jgi:lysylphosphatidylglycerol synthetase-like protein (DUF2156 family)
VNRGTVLGLSPSHPILELKLVPCNSMEPLRAEASNYDALVRASKRIGMRMTSSIWRRYAYGWITLAFFLLTLFGHWIFAWFAFVEDQHSHQQPIQISQFVIQTSRDMLENWQSEFLQLLWQVGGLAFLLYVGSPQSKESDDRQEAKLDAILKAIDPDSSSKMISSIDRRHGR